MTSIDDDPMHTSTSKKRKSFTLVAIASSSIAIAGAIGALALGVTPTLAAELAQDPDTQIAVFMVPLTLLVLAMLFEVARIAFRGALPAESPVRRPPRRPWSPGRGEG